MSEILNGMDVRTIQREDYDRAVKQLREAAQAYYDTDVMIMTDAEYDAGVELLRQVLELHPDWSDDGLTTAVAGGASAGGKVVHPQPMLSLDKMHDRTDIDHFLNRLGAAQVLVEPKIDGLAVRVEYHRGHLALVATRGDGASGDDVTTQAVDVRGLPAEIGDEVDLSLRGEIYMTYEDFEEAKRNRVAAGKPPFRNPRNATSGVLRTQERVYSARLSFAAYGVDGIDDSYFARMQKLSEYGIQSAVSLLPGSGLLPASASDKVQSRIDEIHKLRSGLPFPIDGAVIKLDSDALRLSLGDSSHSPRWAMAFKYPPDTAITKLRDIELSVGRTGRIGVRAVLDPTLLDGSVVTYASLHHPQFVVDADIRIGDEVWVYKAGDIIPQVTAPNISARDASVVAWNPPDNCPQCSEPLEKTSLLWRCVTPSCSLDEQLRYFASRDIMDVDGLDEAVSSALVTQGKVNSIADLYKLTEADLADLNLGVTKIGTDRKLGVLTARKILAGIEASKNQPLGRVIASLGIRGTGRRMSRRLASHFGSLQALRTATIDDLAEVEGMGEVKAELVVKELQRMSSVIDELIAAGVRTTEEKAIVANQVALPLAGRKVVVTGTVPGLSRTEAQEAVELLGGTSSSSISSKVDLVVVGEGAGSKLAKAQELQIEIMPADEFAGLVRGFKQVDDQHRDGLAVEMNL